MRKRRLTYRAQALLVRQAVTPDESQYLALYTSPFSPGLRLASIWSPNHLDTVKQEFSNEFYNERPRLLLAHCPGSN
jgi:hypothetical protein